MGEWIFAIFAELKYIFVSVKIRIFCQLVFIAMAICWLASCNGTVDLPPSSGGGDTGDGGVQVIDGKVKFRVSLDDIPTEFFTCGILSRNLTGHHVRVGNTDYEIQTGEDNMDFVLVDESPFNSYSAALVTGESSSWFGTSPFNDIKLPQTILAAFPGKYSDIPLLCEWKKEDGAALRFKAPYSLLLLKPQQACTIVSARIKSSTPLTGTVSYLRSQDRYEVKSAAYRINVNSTGASAETGINSVAVRAGANCQGYSATVGGYSATAGMPIPVILLPGVEAKVEIRLCDANSLMSEQALDISVGAGQAKTIELPHTPDPQLIFFEGFDRCVWGGNPVEGTEGTNPFGNGVTSATGAECDGYEDAIYACGATVAGAGFVQNSFIEETSSVVENAYMSASYIHSRGFDRFLYMLRVQEYDGCISVGVPNRSRGWVRMYPSDRLNGLSDVTVKFSICLQPGFTDVINFISGGSGVIVGARVDGEEVRNADCFTHNKTSSCFRMDRTVLDVPFSLQSGMKWQQVEVDIKNASEVASLSWQPETYDVQTNGFWLDEISLKKNAGSWNRSAVNSLRILYWNIQNGMWGDQGNNYDNFVAWVKKYEPDICVWCEGRSNFATGTATSNNAPYLTADISEGSGWAELAARYGHNYVASAYRSGDNYPQIVSSRYPLRRELVLGNIAGENPIAHGSGMFKVDCGGTGLNVVTVHLKPNSGEEYDNYRLSEIRNILSATVNSPGYSGVQNWVMLGDFNSKSHYDKDFYNAGASEYLVHEYIAANTSLVDLMHALYPGRLICSTSSSRIDYMFLSPDLYEKVTDACTVVDSWAVPSLEFTGISNFYLPSDHRPILVQLKMQ